MHYLLGFILEEFKTINLCYDIAPPACNVLFSSTHADIQLDEEHSATGSVYDYYFT